MLKRTRESESVLRDAVPDNQNGKRNVPEDQKLFIIPSIVYDRATLLYETKLLQGYINISLAFKLENSFTLKDKLLLVIIMVLETCTPYEVVSCNVLNSVEAVGLKGFVNEELLERYKYIVSKLTGKNTKIYKNLWHVFLYKANRYIITLKELDILGAEGLRKSHGLLRQSCLVRLDSGSI